MHNGTGSHVPLVVVHLVVLCSVCGGSFQRPSWSYHKAAMVTDAISVLWQEVEVCKVLQKPERCQLSVRYHRAVHFIPLDEAPPKLPGRVGLISAAHLAGLRITTRIRAKHGALHAASQ